MSTPDATVTRIDAPEHVTFVDERPDVSDPLVQPTPIAPTAPLTLPDIKMTAEQLLSNPIQIGTFDWSTSDARNAVLASYDVPAAFIQVESFQKAMLGIYAFLKCNLIITIKLNSTRFHQGALWPFVDPMRQMLDVQPIASNPAKFVNVYSASSNPRVEIDAAQSNPVTLRIPFKHIQDRFTTNSKETFDIMARVRVLVASPLRAATGSIGTVTGQVFIHCEDVSLDTPIYPHTPIIPSLMHSDVEDAIDGPTPDVVEYPLTSRPDSPLSPPSFRNRSSLDMIRRLIRENNRSCNEIISRNDRIKTLLLDCTAPLIEMPPRVEMHGLFDSIGSAVSDVVSGVSGAVYNVATGNFGKAATSASKALSGVGKGMSSLNLDKPSDPSFAVQNTIMPVGPLSHGTGVDRSVRLGAAPLGAYLESRFAGDDDISMDLYARAQIPGLVDIIPWNTEQVPGTVLRSIPVLPSYGFTEPTTSPSLEPDYVRCYNTNLSYIAEMFVYWRMSMIYTIKAYCSQFHAGRLMMTFTPNQRLTPPADLSQYSNLPAVYFDIQGNTLCTVAVPFDSSLTRKTYAPWGTESSRFQYTDQHILGYFDIVVMNRLVAPSNVFGDIELFVLQSAGPDVEFESPRTLTNTRFNVPVRRTLEKNSESLESSYDKVEMHADAETTSRSNSEPQMLAKNSAYVQRMNVFNEGVRDARELTRRFTPISFYSLSWHKLATDILLPPTDRRTYPLWNLGSSNWAEDPVFRVTPYPETGDYSGTDIPVQNAGGYSATSFHSRIARMNVFYHGGMRYKVVPIVNRSESCLFSVSYVPDYGDIPIDLLGSTSTTGVINGCNPYMSYSSMLTNTSQNAALEVECPFMNGYNQIVVETVAPASQFPPDVLSSGSLTFNGLTDNPTVFPLNSVDPDTPFHTYSFVLFSSTADDAVFHYCVAPPVTYQKQTLVPPPVL